MIYEESMSDFTHKDTRIASFIHNSPKKRIKHEKFHSPKKEVLQSQNKSSMATDILNCSSYLIGDTMLIPESPIKEFSATRIETVVYPNTLFLLPHTSGKESCIGLSDIFTNEVETTGILPHLTSALGRLSVLNDFTIHQTIKIENDMSPVIPLASENTSSFVDCNEKINESNKTHLGAENVSLLTMNKTWSGDEFTDINLDNNLDMANLDQQISQIISTLDDHFIITENSKTKQNKKEKLKGIRKKITNLKLVADIQTSELESVQDIQPVEVEVEESIRCSDVSKLSGEIDSHQTEKYKSGLEVTDTNLCTESENNLDPVNVRSVDNKVPSECEKFVALSEIANSLNDTFVISRKKSKCKTKISSVNLKKKALTVQRLPSIIETECNSAESKVQIKTAINLNISDLKGNSIEELHNLRKTRRKKAEKKSDPIVDQEISKKLSPTSVKSKIMKTIRQNNKLCEDLKKNKSIKENDVPNVLEHLTQKQTKIEEQPVTTRFTRRMAQEAKSNKLKDNIARLSSAVSILNPLSHSENVQSTGISAERVGATKTAALSTQMKMFQTAAEDDKTVAKSNAKKNRTSLAFETSKDFEQMERRKRKLMVGNVKESIELKEEKVETKKNNISKRKKASQVADNVDNPEIKKTQQSACELDIKEQPEASSVEDKHAVKKTSIKLLQVPEVTKAASRSSRQLRNKKLDSKDACNPPQLSESLEVTSSSNNKNKVIKRQSSKKATLVTVHDTISKAESKEKLPSCKFVGVHCSITGGLSKAVYEAVSYGAKSFGLFLRNGRNWTLNPVDEKEVEKFKNGCKENNYLPNHILPHGSYLLNCGSSNPETLRKSRETLIHELKICEKLGLTLYTMHPGSACHGNNVNDCIKTIAESINIAHQETHYVKTLIENMAGQGKTIGSRLEELKDIISKVKDKSRIGVCLDTCHAYAAGFNLATKRGFQKFIKDFENIIGLQYLCAVHLNDAKEGLGSNADRHENIGHGHIGLDGFRHIMNDERFNNIPMILETPQTNYAEEIKILYGLQCT